MSTRRERKEARLEKRREWAEKRDEEATRRWEAGDRMFREMDGQPILVGHHSEKRHRAAIRRANAHLQKGSEAWKMAAHHRSVAGGIADQLDRSIFSDDANAIEELERRIADHEAKRARMREVNRLYRKGDAAGLAALGHDLESLRRRVAAVGLSFVRQPYEKFELANLGGRISADRKRIEEIRRRAARQVEAEDAGGIVVVRSGDFARVTFAEKPSRETINALKAAGYRWGGGSWSGYAAKLPAGIEPEPCIDCDGTNTATGTCEDCYAREEPQP